MSNSSNRNHINRKAGKTTEKWNELGADIGGLIELAEKLNEQVIEANTKLASSTYPGLNFLFIRDALCELISDKDNEWIPNILATSGSGPWEEGEFDLFLMRNKISLFNMPDDDINGLIVGHSGWNGKALSEQIYNRDSTSLKIYTQELFVLGLIVGKDPYEFLERKKIDDVGASHPAIQFILNNDFVWPWSNSYKNKNSNNDWDDSEVDWAHESVLRQAGYSASERGPTEYDRRIILTKVFESSWLPGIDNSEQRSRWGGRKSARRLHAISHFLGWLINLQGSEKPAAREKWLSDLKWLKKEFYDKTMSFSWPSLTQQQSELTKLNPSAAWPFETKKNTTSNRVPQSNTQLKLLYPRHALGIIIGHGPRPSVKSAVDEVRKYIKNNNLKRSGTNLIENDANMFALAGTRLLDDKNLEDLVAKNLRQ